MPLLTSKAKSPHEAIYGFRGDQLMTVRSGQWKLLLAPPAPPKFKVYKPEDKWVDPRRPDGVHILAPYEQAHPSEFPGLLTGDAVTGAALFDLEKDPGEQHNLAEKHPDVVKRLQGYADRLKADLRGVPGLK
jgi:arylsulfatase A-like enzyme